MEDIKHIKGFLDSNNAKTLFERLLKLDWEQPVIKIFGKATPIPRKQLLFTTPEVTNTYTYSGLKLRKVFFEGAIEELKLLVEKRLGMSFNTALVNLYQNGDDYVGWHSDDESLLGTEPTIVSVSLGGSRFFHLRNKKDKSNKNKFLLENGDLFIMGSSIQKVYQHAILKEKSATKPRINITLRNVIL